MKSVMTEVKNNNTRLIQRPLLDVSHKERHKRESIILDDDEAWYKYFLTRITNEREPTRKQYVYRNNGIPNYILRYTVDDKNKFKGKQIEGKIAEKIKKEISNKNNALRVMTIKESRNTDNIVEPAIRIMLLDNKKEVNISELLNSDVCTKYTIKAITLCKQDKTRGIRARIDKNGTRIYEVANGSYEMTLKWSVQGKECIMKINIDASGSVKLISHNAVTIEDLRANNVKVGVQLEAKYLYEHEGLVSQVHKSSETVRLLEQPSTNMTDTSTTHQACATCHK
jgi:hypothetical protein